MFGEFDSESPRVPSPWDSLTPPSSPKHNAIPKLVPEADEGNVEYKLQLLSPTPARFARLVTQLKWRLLEGGGQAYYELGVADSGMLVGLPRRQLEESLETLEMMAGEIGASVIVVKEIEVPPELSTLAQSQIEKWDGKRSTRRKDLLRMGKQDRSPTMSTTEPETELSSTDTEETSGPFPDTGGKDTLMVKQDRSPTTSVSEPETELSNTDITDTEEMTNSSPSTPPALLGREFTDIQPTMSLNPSPFDLALAMFAVDLEEDVADYADNEAVDDDVCTESGAKHFVNLEISSVYKPRPMKKRAIHIIPPQSNNFECENGYPHSTSIDCTCHAGDSASQDSSEIHSYPKRAKTPLRRDKRDKRREPSPSIHITVPTRHSLDSPTNPVDADNTPSCPRDESSSSATPPQIVLPESPITGVSKVTAVVLKEPRLIVEVLVVRKLSLDEAFLDFEGFSLQ